MAGTLPPGLVERARALRGGGVAPPPTRDAATVALLRDGPTGLQVYLLRRVTAMAFAGGMHVFPGGSVDPADAASTDPAQSTHAAHSNQTAHTAHTAHTDSAWAGPPPGQWAAAFSCTEALARALVCAAVRETFEESGVLLAGSSALDVLADVSTDEWEVERAALEAREQSLSELLTRRGLVLRADLLRPFAHWITPEVEPKRFDTRFFLAAVPPGQVCREAGSEADQRIWVTPAEALDGGLAMLPPTAVALQDLAQHADVASALAASRVITPVLPKLVVGDDDEVAFLLPGEQGYPAS